MSWKKNIAIYMVLISWLSSCDFGNTNLDPTTLPDVEIPVILPSALAQTARNISSIGARVTGSVIQHFKGIEGQTESYSVYLIDENTIDEFWRTGLYSAAMRDCHTIIEKSEAVDAPHYSGIAKILMAMNLGIATTFWGDVPFQDAFVSNNFKPSYDTQEEIYEHIQSLLDQAIEDLSGPPGALRPDQTDLIFGGDASAWTATARALKARYYLHLSKRHTEAAVDALNALDAGAEMTDENVPWFPYGNSQNEANTFAFFGDDRANQLALGDYLFTLMNAYGDPRLTKYAVRENNDYLVYQRNNRDLFWTQFESPLPLISYTEILFIKAECNLRIGNLAQADAFLQQAIASNMNLMSIADYSAYQVSIGDLFDQPTYEDQLEFIMEQKYVALFSQGTLESWVDYRRTGYPRLDPAADANESFNPSKVVPRRYLYPISERNANLENMTQAIERQGGHLLDQDLWAFRN
ncbi:MAG: SusD/RagB family nutrient-binding outer membrane lipoprotein [Reichenbachiella sp.]|uniref:SusD/RagB family nutrient-binding outer membrane lipoprotein n=1 Tax=Reichenbachiella sp. TaxID=2184521 RepID=UPI0032995039